MLDCLVIGAGPAGLTAAIYLARFHLSLQVIDAGDSRAAKIPRTHNHPGYPGGIPGPELLDRMRRQAAEFGVVVRHATVDRLTVTSTGFEAVSGDATIAARTVLLATGVVNHRPPMDPVAHDEAVARGLLRYCPICDGYEVTDQRVAVIGSRTHGYNEAVFLRMYTRDVTLVAPGAALDLAREERARLRDLNVEMIEGPCAPLRLNDGQIEVPIPDRTLTFDSIYPALGSRIRSDLAVALGAAATAEGCLEVDAHQRTSVAGIYAAGDVVRGLDQISHAMGGGGVAATTIRNDLAERIPLLRE